MISHPDYLSDLADFQHQDRLREVEMWRLAREAQQGRIKFLEPLLHRLLAAARQRLRIQAKPTSAMSDLVDLRR